MLTGIHRILQLSSSRCSYKIKGYLFYQPIARCFSDWHIIGSICLERKPILTQEFTSLEKDYLAHLQQLEFEKSHFSNHEMQHIEDLEIAEKLKKGEVDDIDKTLNQTAEDFEDSCQKELDNFKIPSRITDADFNNDQKSIQRKLDQSLFLIIKQKLGNDQPWIFPQAHHLEGETLRQTAERALTSICAEKIKFQVLGNAPFGFFKYKYPKVARENGVCGAKIFFYKSYLLKRNFYSVPIKTNEDIVDYLWATPLELKQLLKNVYYKSIEPFLVFEQEEDNEEIINEKQTKNTAVN